MSNTLPQIDLENPNIILTSKDGKSNGELRMCAAMLKHIPDLQLQLIVSNLEYGELQRAKFNKKFQNRITLVVCPSPNNSDVKFIT